MRQGISFFFHGGEEEFSGINKHDAKWTNRRHSVFCLLIKHFQNWRLITYCEIANLPWIILAFIDRLEFLWGLPQPFLL